MNSYMDHPGIVEFLEIAPTASSSWHISTFMKSLYDLMGATTWEQMIGMGDPWIETGWPALDELLGSDISEWSSLALVCLLKTTSQMQWNLKNWHDCRDRVHQILMDRGEKADDILSGLYT